MCSKYMEVKFIIIIIIINNILATGKYSTFEFWIENGQYSKARQRYIKYLILENEQGPFHQGFVFHQLQRK